MNEERRDKTTAEILEEERQKFPPDGRLPGAVDPEEAGRILREHFENLTPEEFDKRNRRVNPHLYVEPKLYE